VSTASRAAEAEKATIAYQIALTKIGAATIAEALGLWRSNPPESPAAAASWMSKAIALVMRRRAEARALARAYYRLERALRTGFTVTDPSDRQSSTTLNDLRNEFRQAAGPDAPGPSTDNPTIPVEPIPGLDADAARQDREAEQEIRTALGNLGPLNLDKKLSGIDTDRPASEVDAERESARDQAGARQAAAAERIALNGARGELWGATSKDRRALGYIRLSRTGTPCGWCAMLISRGPVYKSEATATTAVYGDGDLYHDNCHCYAVPVWTKADWQSNPLYALNREYQELWPQVTKGLGGDAALTAWRRFIRTQQRAQAARPTRTAQEA
jgi:hypothetical protein